MTKEEKGQEGERIARDIIQKVVDCYKGEINVYNNIILELPSVFGVSGNGIITTEIDHLIITPYLIVLIETKNEAYLKCDYKDDYSLNGLPVKMFDFTSDIDKFVKYLNTPVIKGLEGGDVPEAVYEALFASIYFYKWRDDAEKVIILIGDAEPHRTPRGTKKITQKTVTEGAKKKGIKLNCIIVPNTK